MSLRILKKSTKSQARVGQLKTAHGVINTPFFMPIATKGAVKNITSLEVEKNLGAEIILSNTYHLMLELGMEIIKKAGGLHNFMNWPKPILTDSGGFQVFSLGKLRKITEMGVIFKDPKSGRKYELTPEKAIEYQQIIGSDIMMVLDECTEYPCTKEYAHKSMELSLRWAERCKRYFNKNKSKQLLFGIVQGSTFRGLREECAEKLVEVGFDGYALGGVSVGKGVHSGYKVLDWVFDNLPYDKPRYVLGMGLPEDIIEGVKRGVDMFDCVIPSREGRHGRLFLWKRNSNSKTLNPKQIQNSNFLNSKRFYEVINITNAKFKKDFSPINENSKLPELREYSKAYLNLLFKTGEPLGMRLATLNNLEFYLELMEKIRKAIRKNEL